MKVGESSPEIISGPWIAGDDARFTVVNERPDEATQQPERQSWTFGQAAKEIAKRLAADHQSIRIAGPSGFGKTRYSYIEVFKTDPTLSGAIDRASVIYADFPLVGDEVQKLALDIADRGAATILVVDECNDQLHHTLGKAAQRQDFKLRIVTMDVETTVQQTENTLVIRLEQASEAMIAAIAKGVAPGITNSDATFVQELSDGFPQMAVLAAQNKGSGQEVIRSVAQLRDRVVWGNRPQIPMPCARWKLRACLNGSALQAPRQIRVA